MTASPPRPARLRLDIVYDSGDWPAVDDLLQRAADAAWLHAGEGDAEASVALMDDTAVRTLNRQFRDRDCATDVLSFPADEPPFPNDDPVMLGDIAIAIETVRRDSGLENKSFEDHLVHLLVHGILHLLGYDHEVADEAEAMEDTERAILADLGIADPYRDRSPNNQEQNEHQ